MRMLVLSVLILVVSACDPEGGQRRFSSPSGSAAGSVTSDASVSADLGASTEADEDAAVQAAEAEANQGLDGSCVRVDGGWGCAQPGFHCIRGWCDLP